MIVLVNFKAFDEWVQTLKTEHPASKYGNHAETYPRSNKSTKCRYETSHFPWCSLQSECIHRTDDAQFDCISQHLPEETVGWCRVHTAGSSCKTWQERQSVTGRAPSVCVCVDVSPSLLTRSQPLCDLTASPSRSFLELPTFRSGKAKYLNHKFNKWMKTEWCSVWSVFTAGLNLLNEEPPSPLVYMGPTMMQFRKTLSQRGVSSWIIFDVVQLMQWISPLRAMFTLLLWKTDWTLLWN